MLVPTFATAPIHPIQPPRPLTTTEEIKGYIETLAHERGVDPVRVENTIACESEYNTKAVSPTSDYGLAQINSKYHPEVSRAQAFDARFSVRFIVDAFAKGHASEWSCYRHLYHN